MSSLEMAEWIALSRIEADEAAQRDSQRGTGGGYGYSGNRAWR